MIRLMTITVHIMITIMLMVVITVILMISTIMNIRTIVRKVLPAAACKTASITLTSLT